MMKNNSNQIVLNLASIPFGSKGFVSSIDSDAARMKKLASMGIVKGVEVEVERRAPFGDLLLVKVLDTRLSIRKKDASAIRLVAAC